MNRQLYDNDEPTRSHPVDSGDNLLDEFDKSLSFGSQREVYRSVDLDIDQDNEAFDAPLFKSVGLMDSHEPYGQPQGVYDPMSLNPKAAGTQPNNWGYYEQGHVQHKQEFFSDNLVVSVRDEGPPAAPGGYLEPNFHFMSTCAAGKVFSALQELLEVHDGLPVDFCVKPTKYKLKCVAYPSGSKMPFNIRIFSTDSPDEVAVEFQRRSGCILAFSSLYRKLRGEMQKLGLCKWKAPSSSFGVMAASDKLPCPKVEITGDQSKATVGCLVDMAASKCVDIKLQALQTLSKLSECRQTQAVLVEAALDTLLDCMSSHVECVHRCAVTGLANVTESRLDACEELVRKDGITSLLSLATCQTSSAQVIRECARALANVAMHLKPAALCHGFEKELMHLRRNSDSRTQGYMQMLDSCVAR